MPEHGGGLQLPRRIEEEVLLGFQIRRVPVILRSAAAEILLTVDLRRNYRRIGQIRRINVAHVTRVVRVIVLTTQSRGVGVLAGLEARVVCHFRIRFRVFRERFPQTAINLRADNRSVLHAADGAVVDVRQRRDFRCLLIGVQEQDIGLHLRRVTSIPVPLGYCPRTLNGNVGT